MLEDLVVVVVVRGGDDEPRYDSSPMTMRKILLMGVVKMVKMLMVLLMREVEVMMMMMTMVMVEVMMVLMRVHLPGLIKTLGSTTSWSPNLSKDWTKIRPKCCSCPCHIPTSANWSLECG